MSPAATNHDVAVQGLIDGYLASIGEVLQRSRLPGVDAASILDDVRTQIVETLAARVQGTPTVADAEAVIAELDPPESYATLADAGEATGVDVPTRLRLRRAAWAAFIVAGLIVPSFIIDLVATFDRNRSLHFVATVPIEIAFITLYTFALLTFKDLLNSRSRVVGISGALYVSVTANVTFSLANILIPGFTLGRQWAGDLEGLHVLLSLIVLVAWGFGNLVLGFLLFQHTHSLGGLRYLLAGISLAVGFGQTTAILVLPILPTIFLMAVQMMLVGFILLRSAR